MKKIMMAVLGMALAVILTGCSKSEDKGQTTESNPEYKKVAEDFVNALIQGDVEKAIQCVDTSAAKPEDVTDIKAGLSIVSQEINDKTLVAKLSKFLPKDDAKTGIKKVIVQFMKGEEKTPNGRQVQLKQVEGTWKIVLGETLILNKDKKEMRKVSGFSGIGVFQGLD